MVSLLGLLFFAALLHSRSLLIGYMADDYDLVYALNRPNFSLLDPLPFGRGTYFRPTVMLSLMLELRSGGGPVIHHAVNLAIHLVNGALLFLILRRLRANPFLACSLTFLLLCHRSSVPNVYWISPRAELLATSGYLMAVIGALHYSNARLAMGSAILTLFGVVLALLSKESAVTIPIALALFLWMAGRETSDSTERRLVWPLVAAGAVLCLIYLIYLAGRFYVRSAGMPIASPVEMAAGAAKGAVLLLLPITESLSDSLSHGVARGPLLVAFAALSIPLMIFWARRNLRAVALTVGLPLLAYLPLLVIQGGGGARVLYLPAALLIIGAAVSSRTRSIPVAIAAGVLGAFMAIASFMTGSDWTRNWALAESCCRDFKQIRARTRAAPIVLLTSPRQIGDAPVLSNDARAFLFYCLNRRPGYVQDLESVAEVILVGSADTFAVEREATADSAAFRYRINPQKGRFVIPSARGRQLKSGDVITSPAGQVRVRRPYPGEGLVTDFEFLPNAPDPADTPTIVEFTGTGFRRIPSD